MSEERFTIVEAELRAFCDAAGDVTLAEARTWVARGWIGAPREPSELARTGVVRRLALIREMRRDFGVEETSLDLVLELIDKLKLETRKFACLNAALEADATVDAEAIRAEAARIFRERL